MIMMEPWWHEMWDLGALNLGAVNSEGPNSFIDIRYRPMLPIDPYASTRVPRLPHHQPGFTLKSSRTLDAEDVFRLTPANNAPLPSHFLLRLRVDLHEVISTAGCFEPQPIWRKMKRPHPIRGAPMKIARGSGTYKRKSQPRAQGLRKRGA